MRTAKTEKNLDIYLMLVMVLIVLSLGGGLWLVGKSIDVRLDEITLRLTSQTGQIRGEIFSMRKEMDAILRQNRELSELCKARIQPEPPTAPAQPKKPR